MSTIERNPLDVWLRFAKCEEGHTEAACDCEEVEAEANTFWTPELGYYVEWYLNSVGLVTTKGGFGSWAQAAEWLESEGFQDFSS